MNIKAFWNVVIKILGILLFFEFLEILSQLFVSLTFIFVPDMEQSLVLPSLVYSTLILALYLIIILIFIFKSSWIVEKLRLCKNTESETLNIDLKISSIITIAVIIVGGIIFVNGFSLLCKSLYDYFKQNNLPNYNSKVAWIIFNSIKALLGYLIMTNSKIFANYISKQSQIE